MAARVGDIRSVEGQPALVSDGQSRTATVGAHVSVGDKLQTSDTDRTLVELPDKGQVLVSFDSAVRMAAVSRADEGKGTSVELASGQLWVWSPGDGAPVSVRGGGGTARVHHGEALVRTVGARPAVRPEIADQLEVIALRGGVSVADARGRETQVPPGQSLRLGESADPAPRDQPLFKLVRATSVWGGQYELWQMAAMSNADVLEELDAPRLPLGLKFRVLSEVTEGLEVASVADGSAGAKAGVQKGDVLLALDGRPVATFADVAAGEILLASSEAPALTVKHGEATRTVTLPREVTPARLAESSSEAFSKIATLILGNEIGKAEAACAQLVYDQPSWGAGWLNLGLLQEHQAKYAEAIRSYKMGRRLCPNDPGLLVAMGRTYARAGNVARGLDSLREAVRLAPEPQTRYLLGRVALLSGHLPEAEEQVASLTTSPLTADQAWGYSLRGTVSQVVHDDIRAARHDFEAAVSLGPGNATAAFFLSGAALAQGEVSAAKVLTELLVRVVPDSVRHLNQMGEIAYREQDWAEARRWFERAAGLNVWPQVFSYNMGSVYFAEREGSRAVEYLEQAIAQEPSFVPAYVALGSTMVSLGKWEVAVQYFQKALDIDPADDGALEQLVALWQKHGQPVQAQKVALRYGLIKPGQG